MTGWLFMVDYLVRATLAEGGARALVARTTNLVEEARRLHDVWPTAIAALGRTLTAAAIMAAMLDEREKLTLQIMGDGPVGRVLAVAAGDGTVKGYLDEPHVHLPLNDRGKLDVAGAVGRSGNLYVLRDIGLKEPYRGMTPIVSGEIGLDVAEYFRRSEQSPAAVGLGVLVEATGWVQAAGGFIVQLLPGAPDELARRLEENLAGVTSVTELIASGWTPEKILARLVHDLPVEIHGRLPLRYLCGCSRARFIPPLISLGRDELASILAEQGHIELRCHFCNQVYTFSPAEASALIESARGEGKGELFRE